VNILLLAVVMISLVSGCGYSKSQIKAIVNETMQGQRGIKADWDWITKHEDELKFATKEDLRNLEKKVKNQRQRSIDYHKKNWPHGCEVSCK